MRWLVNTLATVGGVGYLPGAPGTAGSLVGLLLGFLTTPGLKDSPPYPFALLAAVVGGFFLGVASSGEAERLFGLHDPSCVVIDECVGMWAVMVAVPITRVPFLAVVAFVLFRVFDIVKPPPLKRLARLPGGWGIMLDDLGASAYTVGVLGVAKWLSG